MIQFERVLMTLVVRQYVHTTGPWIKIIDALHCRGSAQLHAAAQMRQLIEQLPHRGGAVPHGELVQTVQPVLQGLLMDFAQRTERLIHAALLPVVPQLQWLLPAQRPYPAHASMPLTLRASEAVAAPYFALPIYGAASELPAAELLLALIEKSLGSRTVKLYGHGNGYGCNEFIATHCIEIGEFTALLTQWRDLYVRHEGIVTQQKAVIQKQRKRRVAEKQQQQQQRRTAAAAAVAEGGGGGLSRQSSKLSFSTISSTNSLASAPSVWADVADASLTVEGIAIDTQNAADAAAEDDFDEAAADAAAEVTSVVSGATGNSTTTLAAATLYVLRKVNELLGIDVTCGTEECVQRYTRWLLSTKMMYQVTKPADHAFTAAQTFYRYIDPWEVKVLYDFTLHGERTRLGRNVYGSSSSMSAANVFSSPSRPGQQQQQQQPLSGSGGAAGGMRSVDSMLSLKDVSVNNSDSRSNLAAMMDAAHVTWHGSFTATVASIAKMQRYSSARGRRFLRRIEYEAEAAARQGASPAMQQLHLHEARQIFADWINIRAHEFVTLWDFLRFVLVLCEVSDCFCFER